VIASDIDHEKLIAEIYCDGRYVALLSQDEGEDNLNIVFPDRGAQDESLQRSVDFAWFKNALDQAKEKLLTK
jgi:hypothetical protein